MKKKGLVLWLTGLSGAGKSTIANELQNRLQFGGMESYILDGDILRRGLSIDLGFSDEDRRENIRRTAEVASIVADIVPVVITALISPLESDRRRARCIIESKHKFAEIFVSAPFALCRERDPKGLYEKAMKGQIPNFTGFNSAYQKPEDPDLVLPTANQSVDESVRELLDYTKAFLYRQF